MASGDAAAGASGGCCWVEGGVSGEPALAALDDTHNCRPALLSLLLRQRERKRPPSRFASAHPTSRREILVSPVAACRGQKAGGVARRP
jgi:hypothetical protein